MYIINIFNFSPIKDVVTYDYGNCFTIQSSKFIAGSTGPMSGKCCKIFVIMTS